MSVLNQFFRSFLGPLYPIFERWYLSFLGNDSFVALFFWVRSVAGILSLVFFAGLIYNMAVLKRLNKKNIPDLLKMILENDSVERVSRWDTLKNRLRSESPAEWKQAVLEADNLVFDIFKRVGRKGVSPTEILMKLKPYELKSLTRLIEAHKVKNRIVREAGSFDLPREKAAETLEHYEEVLKELEYID